MLVKSTWKIEAWPGIESWPLQLIGCNTNGGNDLNGNNYMKWLDHILNAVAIWPVTGQCFQNAKWPAVLYILNKFHKSKKPANLSYHMSIKKGQAILKCFIDLKCSVCLTLSSKNETMLCDFRLTVGQSGIFNKFDISKNPKQSERIDADELSKGSSTGNEILDNHMWSCIIQKKLRENTQSGHAQFRFRSTTMIQNTNLSNIYIESFNYSSSKSVKDIKKVCIKCTAGFKALGPVQVLPCSWPRSILRSSFVKLVSCTAT